MDSIHILQHFMGAMGQVECEVADMVVDPKDKEARWPVRNNVSCVSRGLSRELK